MRDGWARSVAWAAVAAAGLALLPWAGCAPRSRTSNPHPAVPPNPSPVEGVVTPSSLSESPASNPVSPKTVEWGDKGVRIRYPSDWRPRKNPDYELMLLPAKPDAGSADRRITFDIPDLPPHLPWMIQMGRIEHDYVQDLRKQHPDLKVEESADGRVPATKSRLVRSVWHKNGRVYNDVALLMIHADGVYILDAQSDGDHLGPTRRAFDLIESSLQWGR